MEELKLSMEDVACGHCEIAVQDAVRKPPGIQKVKASKRRKEAVVHYDASVVSRSRSWKRSTARVIK